MVVEQQSLLKQLQDQKLALDHASIVAATDVRGNITYVNDQFCKISGYSSEELLGQTHKIVNSKTHSKAFFQDMWKTISSGQVWQGEVCNRKKSGELYWVDTTITPFLDDHGKPYQYLAIRHDITDLKKAEQTILEQQERLVASSKLSAVGELAACITHEINNPLGVILGRCEMMKEMIKKGDLSPETISRQVEMIEATGKRIEKIVKSMRMMSTQAARAEEAYFSVTLGEVVEDALALCSQRFANHSVDLTVENPFPDLKIETTGTHLVQILVNLLNNAFDAVQSLNEKWVRVNVVRNQGTIAISVTDSGHGVPSEIQEKIFTPFFTTKDIQYGTGLGLGISKKAALKLGGNLVLNNSSANTQFVLTFPEITRKVSSPAQMRH